MQELTKEQQAQRDLQIIKSCLDAAVKGSVFENMDQSFAAANAFNNVALLVKTVIESKNEDGK